MVKVYIAGAHSRAQTLACYLTYLDNSIRVLAYLYDNEEENPTEIDGVPVIKITKGIALDSSCPVYLAVRGTNAKHFEEVLRQYGMENIIPLTPQLDQDLRNAFIPKAFEEMNREFHRVDEDPISSYLNTENHEKCSVFVAKTPYDSPTKKEESLIDYERLLQVGKALMDEVLPDCKCFDNQGENISILNRHFSELTGLYWIWKNTKEDVVGLEHYRRRFILPKGWQGLFDDGQVDVILPVPLYVAPSLEGNYLFRHDPHPWNAMIDCLKNDVGMYEQAKKFFGENGCFSPCNMLIAKREVVDDLCSWMFPILLKVVDEVGELPDAYQNRYAGFLSERMISFFFYYYADKYKVVYADKSFLG